MKKEKKKREKRNHNSFVSLGLHLTSEPISDFRFELQCQLEAACQSQAAAPWAAPGESDQGALPWPLKEPPSKTACYEPGPYFSLPSEGHSLTCPAVILLLTKNAVPSITGTLLGTKEAISKAAAQREALRQPLSQRNTHAQRSARSSSSAMALRNEAHLGTILKEPEGSLFKISIFPLELCGMQRIIAQRMMKLNVLPGSYILQALF